MLPVKPRTAKFWYAESKLVAERTFGYGMGVMDASFTVLKPGGPSNNSDSLSNFRIKGAEDVGYRDRQNGALGFAAAQPLTGNFEKDFGKF